MLASILALAWAPPADAADAWVLHAGDAAEANARAAADAGRPLWELEPVRLTERVPQTAVAAAGADIGSCTGPTSDNDGLRKLVARGADKAVQESFEPALADLTEAQRLLPCLDRQVEATLGKDLYVTLGVARFATGDSAGARVAFAQALAFDPSLAWTRFPPSLGKELFDAAKAALASAPQGPLVLGPGLDGVSTLFVDGRLDNRAERTLGPGTHLVQWADGDRFGTAALTVTAQDPVVLYLPASVTDDLIELEGPNDAAVLSGFASAMFPAGDDVYAWTGERTLFRVGEAWNELETRPAADAPSTARSGDAGKGLRTGGLVTLGVGALAAGVGGFLAATTASSGDGELNLDCNLTNPACGDPEPLYNQAVVDRYKTHGLGLGLVFGGAAGVVTGAVLVGVGGAL